MIVAGIDYSLSSPAICIHEGDTWDYNNCKFYYLVKREKQCNVEDPYFPSVYPEYNDDLERYENLSNWSLNILSKHKTEKAFIEGYAFGAVGRVFQIAENAGLLKYMISRVHGIDYGVFAPTEIKKFATGKGNANKEKMLESFFAETGVDIRSKLDIMNHNVWNPISDIVDSYYIAKFGFVKETENASQT